MKNIHKNASLAIVVNFPHNHHTFSPELFCTANKFDIYTFVNIKIQNIKIKINQIKLKIKISKLAYRKYALYIFLNCSVLHICRFKHVFQIVQVTVHCQLNITISFGKLFSENPSLLLSRSLVSLVAFWFTTERLNYPVCWT